MAQDSMTPAKEAVTVKHTMAMLLTSRQPAAIAVLGVFGMDAATAISAVCSNISVIDIPIGNVVLTLLSHDGMIFDRGLLIKRSETCFELHLHGGMAVVDQALLHLRDIGVQILSGEAAGENYRFYITNTTGEKNWILAEAMEEFGRMESLSGVRLLTEQISGGLNGWIKRCITRLSERSENKSNETLRAIQNQAQWILARWNVYKHLFEKPRIVLIGSVNAGKSTLANSLQGRPGSIGSPEAGTTRDWLDTTITIAHADMSILATIVDTAGIRETDDNLERESILRTREQMRTADLLLVVVDVQHIDCRNYEGFLKACCSSLGIKENELRPIVVAINKIDLSPWSGKLQNWTVPISALRENGMDNLSSVIWEALGLSDLDLRTPMAWTRRQRGLLEQLVSAHDVSCARRIFETIVNG